MPLDIVAQVVANNGSLPFLQELLSKEGWFTRKNGMKLSAIWFVLVVMIFVPLAGISNAPDEVMGSLAVIGFFGAFLMFLISWLFLPSTPKGVGGFAAQQNAAMPAQFVGSQRPQGALPPQQSIPVDAYTAPGPGSWRDTNDLQPHSVTEGTTKIFKEQK